MRAFLTLFGAKSSWLAMSTLPAVHPFVVKAASEESSQATFSADRFTLGWHMIARTHGSGAKAVRFGFSAAVDIAIPSFSISRQGHDEDRNSRRKRHPI